ncbi:MAG TPA: BBP7 family outer membrane beta-barrel protein [Gemmataceae bacterium]|nr:BBP7 family outer membrane beta-barrel protein [Gemmataceae bacterium]
MNRTLLAALLAALTAAPACLAQSSQAPAPPDDIVPPLTPVEEGPAPVDCADADRFDFRVDYILWWLREGRIPALLTTSSPASAGLLGRPDTRVFYGDDRIQTRHDDRFNGVRFDLGWWFDDAHTLGVEGGAFFLERDSTHFEAVSDGSTVLARPYFNALTGAPESEIIAGDAATGPRNGGFVGYSRIELYGEEINLKTPLLTDGGDRLELLAGAHFLQMRDRVDLTATGWSLTGTPTLFGLTDHFRADDRFYGGQIGLRGEVERGRWGLQLTAEIAPGVTDATVQAFGDRTVQTAALKTVTPYGLAVQPSNTGGFGYDAFDFVSQVRLDATCRLTQRIKLFVGYTFLYWNAPLRAGDQIDLSVNPSLPTGPARPAIPFHTDNFWAQGGDVGLQFSW